MKRIVLLSTIIVIFISSVVYSQITLQVGAGGGYVSPTGDYTGSTVDFITEQNMEWAAVTISMEKSELDSWVLIYLEW